MYCTFISNQGHLIELFCTRATKRNNRNCLCHSIAAQHNATSTEPCWNTKWMYECFTVTSKICVGRSKHGQTQRLTLFFCALRTRLGMNGDIQVVNWYIVKVNTTLNLTYQFIMLQFLPKQYDLYACYLVENDMINQALSITGAQNCPQQEPSEFKDCHSTNRAVSVSVTPSNSWSHDR